jgi:hypothetical protein
VKEAAGEKGVLLIPIFCFGALSSLWLLAPVVLGCSKDVHPLMGLLFFAWSGFVLLGTWGFAIFGFVKAIKYAASDNPQFGIAVTALLSNFLYVVISWFAVNAENWQLLCAGN